MSERHLAKAPAAVSQAVEAKAAGEAAAKVLVYGLGRSGLAALEFVSRGGQHQSCYFERRESGPDVTAAEALGAKRYTAEELLTALASATGGQPFQSCLAAPGVPIDHPHLELLRGRGVEVIGEVEWVWRHVPGRYIGVTGTAGKGSVTRWCADMLAAAGQPAVAGGNIDPALAAVAGPGKLHVVELSSFQLERCNDFRPDIAVLLNLGEDHLDRHGSVTAYHAAKRRLLKNLGPEQTLVVNGDDPVAAGWAAASPAKVRRFSLCRAADAHLASDGQLMLEGQALLHRSELQVIGDHQVANGLAVCLAGAAAGLARDQIAAGLRAFTGLAGRYSAAGAIGAISFVEDSIATRPLSVAAALKSTARPRVWIAGGQDKGADVSALQPLVAGRVDLLITIGESGPALARAFVGLTEVVDCSRPTGAEALSCAVRRAVTFLRERHAGSGNVLLAPLAASFDQFKDYAERAKLFRQAVATFGSGSGG